jgi:hypothetical protein
MADFTIGINIRDDKIFVTISIEDREAETFTIEEAESFQDILGLQINLAKPLQQRRKRAAGERSLIVVPITPTLFTGQLDQEFGVGQ